MEFIEFLEMLMTPEFLGVVLGILMAILAEYWPEYEVLPKRQKRAVFFAASVLIPVAASITRFLFGFGPEVANFPEFWMYVVWPGIVAGVTAFTSGTITHMKYMKDE